MSDNNNLGFTLQDFNQEILGYASHIESRLALARSYRFSLQGFTFFRLEVLEEQKKKIQELRQEMCDNVPSGVPQQAYFSFMTSLIQGLNHWLYRAETVLGTPIFHTLSKTMVDNRNEGFLLPGTPV